MKFHIYLVAILAIALGLSTNVSNAIARPVSYPGGFTIMQNNSGDKNSLHLHYSPTAKYSVGYKGEYFRDAKWQFHGVQANYLLKRWNKKASQANFYLKGAGGFAYSDFGAFEDEYEPAAFAGIATDWEDRRFFTSYEATAYSTGDIADEFAVQKARVGVAPYLGEYGDLHTWLMLEVEHNSSRKDKVKFTPMVRMFKDVYLIELGIDDEGEGMFNWIVRF